MAINSTTVWRIRISGNDTNGAGYDSAISGAGTDYSQQDSPQMSVTDIACSNNTTVTSATGGFTSAMIGNAIRISGGGSTTGYYFITAHTNTNTVTVDRTPGTVSGGTGKVGGAAASLQRIADDNSSTGNKMVAGNTVYLRGSTSTPTTHDYDYNTGTFYTPVAGNQSNPGGRCRLIGENGTPMIRSAGLMWYATSTWYIENVYIRKNNGNNESNHGVISNSSNMILFNCTIDSVASTGANNIIGLALLGGSAVINCYIKGNASGSGTGHGVTLGTYGDTIIGSRVSGWGGIGIDVVNMPNILFCVIDNNYGDGIEATNTANNYGGLNIVGNIIYGNGGHGIKLTEDFSVQQAKIFNNIIMNNTGSGKAGIRCESDSTDYNDLNKVFINYNNFYNNTSNFSNISGGSNDQTLDPQFVDAGNADFRIGTALKGLGYPGTIKGCNTSAVGYMDIGAFQRLEEGNVYVLRKNIKIM